MSVYCSRHLPGFLKTSVGYQDGDVFRGFCEAYMSCDRKLLTEEALKEMKVINETDSNEEEEELNGEKRLIIYLFIYLFIYLLFN